MSSAVQAALLRPAPQPVIYPQRRERAEGWLDRLETAVTIPAVRCLPALWRARFARLAARIDERSAAITAMSDAALGAEADELRELLTLHGFRQDLVTRSFALVREAAMRSTGMRHYRTQLMGGLALLKGMVAEMETGEGKTLTATLAAATAALAGMRVHVVTVNDYLAQRDAEAMSPIYEWLGLKVGTVVAGLDPEQRRHAYACEVTYCCNKEIAFDYLRDRLVLGKAPGNLRLKLERLCGRHSRRDRLVMNGLPFAIVDEVDSVLVDEARTPLIISGETQPEDEQRWAEDAMGIASTLEQRRDYRILLEERRIELTAAGRQRLAELGEKLGGAWRSRIQREESARQALSALHLFRRDDHYLVRDGRVEIIDEYTGRVMPDRSWSEGLHQLVEVKEGCPVTGRKLTLARISYQRFFRRYRRLAGMTGTAREVAAELWAVYRLPVVTMPTFRPLRRRRTGGTVFRSMDEKWEAIAARTRTLQEAGRPVLVGTRSVAASEALGRKLTEAGVAHVVLSAAQDRDEAEVIARAGEPGRVTVATNMAGRGVDIRLAEGVAKRGGLHVILSERHEAGRIDRQLAGRSARQGDPGSYGFMLSLEDPLLEFAAAPVQRILACLPAPLARSLARVALRHAQLRAERTHSRMRRDLLRSDQQLGTVLAFAGEGE